MTADRPAGTVRVQGCEPRSLLPASVDRFCGTEVAQALYTPLVEEADADGPPRWGAAADHAMAASIASEDAITWRIQLQPDWVFHDGEPIRAEHFVDAWNFAAYGPNAQPLAFLFEPIVGFSQVNCPTAGCEPTATELDGLRVVDELAIEVELEAPDRYFPHRLGHVAFSPLPPQALEDPAAFEEAPIGNGPLRIEGSWRHNEGISLRPHDDYAGAPAPATAIEVVLFDEVGDAWDELEAGRLDVATVVPRGLRQEARARYAHEVTDGDRLDVLIVPAHRADLQEPALVQALSQAIDRQAIIDEHLGGLARPATGLMPPVVTDQTDRCGTLCTFAPEAARQLIDQAVLPERGIQVWIDQDADHAPWARAILQQWREHLDLDVAQTPIRTLRHTAWVSHLEDRRVGGLYPLGWTMDVASPVPYLDQLHLPGGLFHFDGHRSPEAADAVARALAAPTAAAATTALHEAESLLLDDLHAVPLWVRQHEAFYVSDVVDDVRMDPRGNVRLAALRPLG